MTQDRLNPKSEIQNPNPTTNFSAPSLLARTNAVQPSSSKPSNRKPPIVSDWPLHLPLRDYLPANLNVVYEIDRARGKDLRKRGCSTGRSRFSTGVVLVVRRF
jgi:hypothetical protein